MKKKVILLTGLVALILCGCTIRHQVRLYDLETGDMVVGTSRIRGNRSTTEVTLSSGERCKGESVTIGEGSVSWGTIYSVYYGSASYSSVNAPTSQRGVSVYVCDRGTVIRCEYVAQSFPISGHGVCRDNRGKYYRAMF